MHLLIIGVGNPIPSFIKRRLAAYVKKRIVITVVVERGQPFIGTPGINIIRIGGKQDPFTLLISVINAFLRPGRFFKMLLCRPELSIIQRLKWAVKYLPLASASVPDVVHFQWLPLVTEFRWLRHYFSCPFVGSARGSQITIYPITRPQYRSIIERAMAEVDYIHCVSQDMLVACEQLGGKKEKMFVNYNGIDLGEFCAKGWVSNSTSEFTMVSVGSFMWRKGHHYQLQLLHKLRKEGRNVRLLCVGDGPDLEGISYTARVLGVESYVTFTGSVEASEVANWLVKGDVYLSTSIAEGLANSAVEAAACGLPLVAFECEGMSEVIESGTNGFILPFGAIEKMREKLIFLLDHPEERNRMGAASRIIAEHKFDQNHWVDLMIKNYESLER
jgi:glycosyltransferase involved in cell wall biosynthesis